MSRGRVAWIGACLLAVATLIVLDWPATLTDEDDYMPHALADLLAGRDPYATVHRGEGVMERPWGTQAYAWETTYPYLPLLLFLQLPGIDYRWTAFVAFGALLVALRGTRWGLWAFANPLGVWLAASGFNDFVPLALVAWSTRAPWLAWVAAACKQMILPLLALEALFMRSWRKFAHAALFTLVVSLPFLVWDARAFVDGVFLAHLDKAHDAWSYWNYWLYLVFALAVLAPARKGYGVMAHAPETA